MKLGILATSLAVAGLATAAGAQTVTLPPSGDNQAASVSQNIGLVKVSIDYSSPDVTGPDGKSRRGQIWGQLVPYGLTDLGWGYRSPAPWRAGANQNTTFSVSHDVQIEGQPLPAGTYGLHMIADPAEWTIVFSRNSRSWGSFFYEPADDVLRVKVKPEPAPFREWLTYDFFDRQPASASVALWWEELRVPFTITVPNLNELYFAQLREEVNGAQAGFMWQNLTAAANFCVQNNFHLEDALRWADEAVSLPFVGDRNITTLGTKATVLSKLGRADEATQVLLEAVALPAATVVQIHQIGRQLLAGGQKKAALAVFQKNAERYGDVWPVNVGLMRGFSANGDLKTALRHAKKALTQAPDPLNKENLERAVKALAEGTEINAAGI